MAARRLHPLDDPRGQDPPYREWVALAKTYPDQNRIWRRHELFAREHLRQECAAYRDLGGEA